MSEGFIMSEGFLVEERASDSPYVEAVMHGFTEGKGATIRPAESCWHMVFARTNGQARALVVGPWTAAGIVPYIEGVELLWIKFKLGTFMPHLPVDRFRDMETALPEAAGRSFWLHGSAWQLPDYENVETFIDRLVRQETLAHDPVVDAALKAQPQELAPRTVRHRFLRATGLSQGQIYQMERARRAEALLRQGVSILDTAYELGYFDQPHLTRALKKWVGYTPAQIVRARE